MPSRSHPMHFRGGCDTRKSSAAGRALSVATCIRCTDFPHALPPKNQRPRALITLTRVQFCTFPKGHADSQRLTILSLEQAGFRLTSSFWQCQLPLHGREQWRNCPSKRQHLRGHVAFAFAVSRGLSLDGLARALREANGVTVTNRYSNEVYSRPWGKHKRQQKG